jgi:hypothetical protein
LVKIQPLKRAQYPRELYFSGASHHKTSENVSISRKAGVGLISKVRFCRRVYMPSSSSGLEHPSFRSLTVELMKGLFLHSQNFTKELSSLGNHMRKNSLFFLP